MKSKNKTETVTLEVDGLLLEYEYLADKVNVKVKWLGLGLGLGFPNPRVYVTLYLKELVTRYIFLNDKIKQIDIEPDSKVVDMLVEHRTERASLIACLVCGFKVWFRTNLPITIYGEVM